MKKGETWRDSARPIIAKVLEDHKDSEPKERQKALKEAYPFGERKYHPYKVWLNEIAVQLKKKSFGKKNNVAPKEQTSLF